MPTKKPILTITILLTLLLEVILIVGVYKSIGLERLPFQLVRLLAQLLLIYFIYSQHSNKALFLLAGYHMLNAIHAFSLSGAHTFQYGIGAFSLLAAFVIYFHQEIQSKLK